MARILEDNDFEGLRLYEPNSGLHKLIGGKVKEVFEKLFQNTDINLDDFYFTGFDDEDSNAFFIEKEQTKDKTKNIIAVSYGLIQKLDSIQELAAIVGHEAGHYVWAQLLGGRNTIFQERGADVHSVDLMLNAGYNPRYVISAQKKIFGNFNYKSLNLNVHGAPQNRISDVESYLTLLATEQGDFENTDGKTDVKYNAFKTSVKYQRLIDGYDTYLDKKLKEKFGTKDVIDIKRIDILRFFFDEIHQGNIAEYSTRLNDFIQKFKQIPMDNDKTQQEIYNLENMFIMLHDKGIETSNLQDFLKHAELRRFGPFIEQYENISSFIKYYDDEQMAEFFAKRIVDLSWTVDFINFFTNSQSEPYPSFRPLGADNVGKKLPWVQLGSYRNNVIDWALRYFQFVYGWADSVYSVFKDYNENDYYIKDDIVIAFGEEARKLHEQDKRKSAISAFQSLMERNDNYLNERLNEFDKLNDFINNRLSVSDLAYRDMLRAYFNAFFKTEFEIPNWRLIKDIQEYNIDTSGVWEQYNKLIHSNYYQNICAKSPEISLYPILSRDTDINILWGAMRFLLAPQDLTNSYKLVLDAQLKAANILTNSSDYKEYAGWLYEDLLEFQRRYDGDYDKETGISETILKEREAVDTYKIWESYNDSVIMGASHNSEIVFHQERYLIRALDKDLSQKSESEIFGNMADSVGIKKLPKTQQELILELNNCPVHNMKFYLLADYFNRGYKCNICDVLDMFVVRSDPNRRLFRRPENDSTPVRDILARHINKEYFVDLPLMDKLRLYEFMDTRKLFSETAANKNSFIKIIVNEIIKHPDYNLAIGVTKNILSRHGNTDMDNDWHNSDFEFANEREKLLDFYSDYWAKKFGRDNGSDEYAEKVKSQFVDFMNVNREDTDEKLFSDMIVKELANRVSNKIMAQEKTAKVLDEARKTVVSGEEAEKKDYYGRAAENVFAILAQSSERALASIKFLNSKLTDASVQELIDVVSKGNPDQYKDYMNKETLSIIHENFWAANLPIRAYLMNRLLNAYSSEPQQKLQLVIDMYFDKNSKYYNDAVVVLNAVYNNLQDYEQSLILAALIASGQQDNKNTNMSDGSQVGRGLKMFLQTKGAAFVKFGQLLSYLPSLDPDIRRELATLREKANIPTRAELFDIIKTSLPEDEYKKISYVGKILGGGSFYITVAIKYNGQDCVLALMRPHTRDLTNSGLNMISNTINEMASKDKKFDALKNIVAQARDSSLSEIDIKQDYEKYQNAVKIYEHIHVHTPSGDFAPDVAKWLAYGADHDNNNAYKIMEMAPGNSLTSPDMSEQEKHDFALAYTTLELSILLSGAQWDTDRHAGQQNFYNKYFRDFCIGIFDTGAQMKNAPNKVDKVLLGHLLYELVRGVRDGRGVGEVLTDTISKIDKAGEKLNIDTMYIDGVQRGLTALSDIIEYQKEAKDEDGNIVQESKSLSATDLQNIITAILDSGIIDTTIMKSITAKAIINKLLIGRRGWFKSLPEGIQKTTSDIVVSYTGKSLKQRHIDKITKAKDEVQKLIDEQNKNKHLGIKIGLTKKKGEDIALEQHVAMRRA